MCARTSPCADVARRRFCGSDVLSAMADVEATDMAQPVVETRASFKKPATQKATPVVKPPSKSGNSAQIKKRQSIKRRPAAAQQSQDEAVSTASKKSDQHRNSVAQRVAPTTQRRATKQRHQWLGLRRQHFPPTRITLLQAARATTRLRVRRPTLVCATARCLCSWRTAPT